MKLIYTNFVTNYKDLETEIEFLIQDELTEYMHMNLEIIFYLKDEEPKTLNITSFFNEREYIERKCFSQLDFFYNAYELYNEDISDILINLYIK